MEKVSAAKIRSIIRLLDELDYKLQKVGRSAATTGIRGELKVALKLIKKISNAKVNFRGTNGQAGYDIGVGESKIEVKASTKRKFKKGINGWGFGGISPEKFDFLVCVAFDGRRNDRFLIFTKKEAMQLPFNNDACKNITGRFNNNEKRTFFLLEERCLMRDFDPQIRKMNKQIAKYEKRWDKIA